MERSNRGFMRTVIKSIVALAIVAAAAGGVKTAVQAAQPKLLAQRITMGPSPDLRPVDVTRNIPAGTFVVKYCNFDNGLATDTMTVSLTNNVDRTKAMSVAGQVVPSGNGACATTSFPCTSMGTSCYEAKNFRVIVDTLGQIYESNETNNELSSFILNPLPGAPTPVAMTCTVNSSSQIQVNLSWGNGGDTNSSTIQIDDPTTATNPDHQRTGIVATVYPVTYSFANNAFAGKTVTGKVWGVNALGNGPVANFQNVTCPGLPQPFNKTGPASGATTTPGNQTFSWTKYTGAIAYNQYIMTFKNSAGAVVLQKRISDINTTSASIDMWQTGNTPGTGETVYVRPPFAIGTYTWQIAATSGGDVSAQANNGTYWTINVGESAGCKPQNMQFTCGLNGDPNKVQVRWTDYKRALRVTFDNLKNTWYTPAYKGDYLFTVPDATYPSGIRNVTATSFVADIDTNQEYDWALHDAATVATGNLTTCRTDVSIKCPAETACHTEGGLCGTGIAGSLGTCCEGYVCQPSGNPDQGGTCVAGRPTNTPTPTPTTTSTNCVCKSDNTCDTSCTFEKFTSSQLSNVSYANPMGCSISSVPFSSTPSQANKNAWCQRSARTQGDSDGNRAVDSKDYFYYVQAVAGGSLPSDSSNNVNPDFNGNGSVGTEDRIIIIKKLGG